MADGVSARIKLPKSVTVGDTITIKTQITHRMESGHRVNALGLRIPRSIIHRFVCTFEGETVVDMDVAPGISINPFFEVRARAVRSGEFTFAWYDDDGSIYTETRTIEVTQA